MLIAAVKNRDAKTVKELLNKRVDPNAAEADGTTALHWAVQHDDLETVGPADQAGANSTSGQSLRRDAAAPRRDQRQRSDLERLLSAGADVNAALPDGETALMTAARGGSVAAVKLLLARGADVDASEAWKGQTALMWAAAENHADVVRVLIAGGADPNARSMGGVFTPFLFAVRGGQIDAARVLLDAGADVNEYARPTGPARSRWRSMNAHYELAAMLLDRGADPNADRQGWTALASDRVDAPAELRLQPPRPGCHRRDRRARARAHARASRRRCERAADEGAARRQPEHAEPHRRHAVPAGGEGGRPAADARRSWNSVPIRRSRMLMAPRR